MPHGVRHMVPLGRCPPAVHEIGQEAARSGLPAPRDPRGDFLQGDLPQTPVKGVLTLFHVLWAAFFNKFLLILKPQRSKAKRTLNIFKDMLLFSRLAAGYCLRHGIEATFSAR